MNIRIVDGRLVRDAEVKVAQSSGARFLTFTIANNTYSNEQEITTYFNVISYNEHDISRCAKFVKGKLLVVTGRPNETTTDKNGKIYINRNIMAYSIESGTFNSNREYNPESTRVISAPTIDVQMKTPEVPKYNVNPSVTPAQEKTASDNVNRPVEYEYAAQMPQTNPVPYADDLPF